MEGAQTADGVVKKKTRSAWKAWCPRILKATDKTAI